MPGIVDVSTGKIIGVKKGTLAYYHEVGHIAFSKSNKGLRIGFWAQSFLILTIIFLCVQLWFTHIYFRILPVTSALLFIILHEYEEIWCWIYAYKKKKN